MAMTYVTLAGPITLPGSDIGISAKVYAIPRTVNGALTYTGDDRITVGPVIGQSDAAGNLGSTLKVPTNTDIAGLLWEIVVEPDNRIPGIERRFVLKNAVAITGTGTIKLRDLAEIEATLLPGTIVDTVAQMVLDAEAARDSAAASAAAAAANAGKWVVDSLDPDILNVTPSDQVSVDPTDADALIVTT